MESHGPNGRTGSLSRPPKDGRTDGACAMGAQCSTASGEDCNAFIMTIFSPEETYVAPVLQRVLAPPSCITMEPLTIRKNSTLAKSAVHLCKTRIWPSLRDMRHCIMESPFKCQLVAVLPNMTSMTSMLFVQWNIK